LAQIRRLSPVKLFMRMSMTDAWDPLIKS
jgi:hypothetical protein